MTTSEAPPPPGEFDAHAERADAPGREDPAPGPALLRAPPAHPAAPPGEARQERSSIVLLVVVTVLSLAADLASKGWATSHLAGFDLKLKGARRIIVVNDHMDFIFAQNPGGAWSFLRSLPDSLRRPFFLTASATAIVFIVSIYLRLHGNQRAMKWGLPLALGGALGNLADRIRYGWVVDFVDVYVSRRGRELHWPTFNVADIAIVVGIGLMAIDMLFLSGRRARAMAPSPSPSPAPVEPPA
jgi:signal peptidase II